MKHIRYYDCAQRALVYSSSLRASLKYAEYRARSSQSVGEKMTLTLPL